MLRRLYERLKNEPVLLLTLLAEASAAAAAHVQGVDVTDPKSLWVGAGLAALAVVQRQLVRPERVAKAADEYRDWLEEKVNTVSVDAVVDSFGPDELVFDNEESV